MKRLFVCEFITCGGMRDRQLPPSLLADAELMYQALLSDLRQIDDLEIISCRDDRLSPVAESVVNISAGENAWQHWARCMETAELAWIIAPETDGVLLRLNKLARESACQLIACDDDAVELTTSKHATNEHLLRHSLPALKSKGLDDELLDSDSGWLVKPDNRAGSEGCYFFQDSEQLLSWKMKIKNRTQYIQQRYVCGIPASMSVLYGQEQTRLLSCNRQLLSVKQGMLINEGIIVNDLHKHHAELETLAIEIGKKIPGLRAYVGIDLVLTDAGPVVIEINPRLTTSYAGLSESLNINVAQLILNAQQDGDLDIFHDHHHNVVARVAV
jgi:tyramine---L-glutamate ligase